MIDIIIPYYNSELYLARTIESILQNEYVDWHLYLVDDGSLDSSFEIANTFSNKDSRIKSLKRPSNFKPGGRGAKNYGFIKSNQPYIVFFDSDDFMLPEFLERRFNLISNNADIDCVFSDFGWKVESDLKLNKVFTYPSHVTYKENTEELWYSYINLKIFWTPSNMLWRRSKLEEKQLTWDSRLTTGEDYLFHGQALIRGLKFGYLNSVDWYYMRNPNSMMAQFESKTSIMSRHLSYKLLFDEIKIIDQILSKNIKPYFFNAQIKLLRRLILEIKGQRANRFKMALEIMNHLREIEQLEMNIRSKIYVIIVITLISKKGFSLFDKLLLPCKQKTKTYDSFIY